MTNVYASDFQQIATREAKQIAQERFESGSDKEFRLFLRRGIYAGLSGPCYETPAEIHFLRLIGADAVGMSTVPEAIAARHQGMKVLGISCITNLAAGMSDEPINHAEVIETGAQAAETFKELLRRVIPKLG
jgi:purine-nucleoside phosphorylase